MMNLPHHLILIVHLRNIQIDLVETIQVNNSYRNIVKLALPISISILIPQVNILTNTLFLGYYHPSHTQYNIQDFLSASGIAGIYYLTLVMVGYGLSSGLLMLMSRRAGQNNPRAIGHLLSHGVFLTGMMSLVLISLSWFLMPTIFNHTIHEPNVRLATISFSQIRFWGLPFVMITQLANSFFLSTSQSSKIIYPSIVQTVVNILLDYLLIFGNFGFPELGLEGSAIASVFADISGMLVFISLYFITKQHLKYPLEKLNHIRLKMIRMILSKSSPLIIQYLLSIGAWLVFFIFVEHIGKAESAASQILRSVYGIVGVFTWALGSTCNSMVSNVIGQKKYQEVIPLILKIVKVSFGVSFVLGLPILFFPKQFLSLLTADNYIIEVGVTSLRIVIVAIWMLSVSTIFFNGVVGTGNTRMNMYFEFIAIILYLIYNYWSVEIKHNSLPYSWASEFIYWFALFALSFSYLYSKRWLKKYQDNQGLSPL